MARIIVNKIRRKLLTHQSHEQSGFTPKNYPTVNRILALFALFERPRYFRSERGSRCESPQGVRLGEPICTLENPGPPQNTPKARQSDIQHVF